MANASDPAGILERNNADSVFAQVAIARAKLATYDYLFSTYESDKIRGWQLVDMLNGLRGEIIHDAIGAFWGNGYTYLPDDLQAMREVLFINRDMKGVGQAPQSLDDLVKFNYIDHLPASPYGDAVVVPEGVAELAPGTIVYKPVATLVPYTRDAGALEFYFLAVIGTDRTGNSPEVVEVLFNGDIHGLVEVIPNNIVSCYGFFPDTNSEYGKALQELKTKSKQ
jgi:hypothetical protein